MKHKKALETYRMATVLIKKRKIDEAKELLVSLIKTDFSESALFSLMDIYIAEKNTEKVKFYCDEIVRLHSDIKEKAYIRLAEYETSIGNLNTAKHYYTTALNSNASSFDAIIGLGELALKMGKIEDAKRNCNEALLLYDVIRGSQYSKNASYVFFLLADIAEYTGNYDEADKHYDRVITDMSKFKLLALIGRGKNSAYRADYKSAKTYYYQVLNDPASERISYRQKGHLLSDLTALLIKIDELDEAIVLLEKYKSFYADDDWFKFDKHIKLFLPEIKDETAIETYNAEIIQHIIERHGNEFCDTVNIAELHSNTLKALQEQGGEYIGSIYKYHIETEKPIALKDGIDTKVVEVVTFMDKTNIVTMYPVIWYGDTIKLNQKVKEKA